MTVDVSLPQLGLSQTTVSLRLRALLAVWPGDRRERGTRAYHFLEAEGPNRLATVNSTQIFETKEAGT